MTVMDIPRQARVSRSRRRRWILSVSAATLAACQNPNLSSFPVNRESSSLLFPSSAFEKPAASGPGAAALIPAAQDPALVDRRDNPLIDRRDNPLVDLNQLVANNAGGLVSNQAASLSGQAWVASNLVANNSAGLIANGAGLFRIASLTEVPLQRALVYLSDTRERPFLDPDTGQILSTTTDDSGVFKFAKAPASASVVVNAVLSGNRRLVGFQVPREKQEAILRLDLASTLVTEFLRERALERSATASLGDLDPDLQALPDLTRLTQEGLASESLTVPDLRVGRIPDMNRAYLVGFASRLPVLRARWETLLGEKLSVIETIAGSIPGFRGDGSPATEARFANPSGLVRTSDGSWIVADTGNNRIRRIAPDGTTSSLAGNGTPETITARVLAGESIDYSGFGGAAAGTILYDPRSVLPLPGGSLLVGVLGNSRILHVDAAGTMRLLVDPHPGGTVSEGNVRAGSPKPTIRSPIGMTLGPDGKVYIADIQHHVVRQLTWTQEASPDTYVIDKVAGLYGNQNVVPIGMAYMYALKPPRETAIAGPYGICFDGQGQLIVTETFGNRVLRLEQADGRLHVLAGTGRSTVSGDGGQATAAGVPYPTAITYDATRNRVLVGSWQSPRIRAIDLATGIISTLAGTGDDSQDGLIRKAAIGDIGGLALDAQGRPVFTEVQTGRVRRLWLSE